MLHPAYSGVTLGLIHGSAPHAYVLCHMAGDEVVDEDPRSRCRRSPSSSTCTSGLSLLARPATVARDRAQHAATSTSDAARRAVETAEAETGLPADDPVRFGPGRLVDALEPLVRAASTKV